MWQFCQYSLKKKKKDFNNNFTVYLLIVTFHGVERLANRPFTLQQLQTDLFRQVNKTNKVACRINFMLNKPLLIENYIRSMIRRLSSLNNITVFNPIIKY